MLTGCSVAYESAHFYLFLNAWQLPQRVPTFWTLAVRTPGRTQTHPVSISARLAYQGAPCLRTFFTVPAPGQTHRACSLPGFTGKRKRNNWHSLERLSQISAGLAQKGAPCLRTSFTVPAPGQTRRACSLLGFTGKRKRNNWHSLERHFQISAGLPPLSFADRNCKGSSFTAVITVLIHMLLLKYSVV